MSKVIELKYRPIAIALFLIILCSSIVVSSHSHSNKGVRVSGEDSEDIYGRMAVVIVLDALNYTVLEKLNASGDIPNIQYLMKNGIYVMGRTIIPSATTAAWTAIATGAPPEINGVVNTYAINATEYHNMLIDEEPVSVSYSDMIKAETIVEVANREGVKVGFLYTEKKVSIACGKTGIPSVSYYYSEPFDAYDSSLPIETRIKYVEELFNKSMSMIDSLAADVRTGGKALMIIDLPEPDASGHTHGPASSYYEDMIKAIDTQIGRLIDYLESSGLWNKTLLFFFTDHSMLQVDPDLRILDSPNHIVGLPLEHEVVGIGTLAYIYLKYPDEIEEAVSYLKEREWVEGIWTRTPVNGTNGTLSDILLNSSLAGDIVISIKKPYYVYTFSSKGAHGGINTRDIPLIISGGMVNTSASLSSFEIIDIAPTLSEFLGMDPPKNATGHDLKVYKNYADVSMSVDPGIAEPGETISISVNYTLGIVEEDIQMQISVNTENQTVYEDSYPITSISGTIDTAIILDHQGEFQVYVKITKNNDILGGAVSKVLVIKISKEKPMAPIIGSAILAIVFGIGIIAKP
ncbi:MAG: alkaline phosphatase family protein, partial [Candidatus Njordarchaeota archaeon]